MVADKLNLACGTKPMKGADWLNVDLHRNEGTDLTFDAFKRPWPLQDAQFNLVSSEHFFEHIPHDGSFFVVMEELHRVMRVGATLTIKTPHWRRGIEIFHGDPTHCRIIHPSQFDCMRPGNAHNFYTSARFQVANVLVNRAFFTYHMRKWFDINPPAWLNRFGKAHELVLTLQRA